MITEFEIGLDQDAHQGRHEARQGQRPRAGCRGKQPKCEPAQEAHLVELWRAGKHTSAELAALFSVARSTVYRAVQRAGEPQLSDAHATG